MQTERTFGGELLAALGQPIAIVVYQDEDEKRRSVAEASDLIACHFDDRHPPQIVTEVATCFDADLTETPLLLDVMPPAEMEVVSEIGARRDQLSNRSAPIIVFCLAGGEAIASLSRMPGLASWIGGRLIDPAELESVDLESERQRFRAEVGEDPESWLVRWHAGQVPDTLEGKLRSLWAGFLAGVEDAPEQNTE